MLEKSSGQSQAMPFFLQWLPKDELGLMCVLKVYASHVQMYMRRLHFFDILP
jgi:hypothetical protein